MTLVKFNNNRTNALVPGINDVFDSIFNDTFFNDRMTTRVPAVNISESPDHFHIELAAPGLQKQDFKISIDNMQLTVSVEKQTENNDRKYNKREYSFSSFVRSFTLPDLADHNQIEAVYEAGLLRIDIAKKEEARSVSRQIELK